MAKRGRPRKNPIQLPSDIPKRRGRPILSPTGEIRSVLLQFRATPSERDAVHQRASLAGLSVSAFLLGQALGDRLGGALKGEGFTASEISAAVPVREDGSIDVEQLISNAEAAVAAAACDDSSGQVVAP